VAPAGDSQDLKIPRFPPKMRGRRSCLRLSHGVFYEMDIIGGGESVESMFCILGPWFRTPFSSNYSYSEQFALSACLLAQCFFVDFALCYFIYVYIIFGYTKKCDF